MRKGFTLVDIVIAIVIVGIFGLALYSTYSRLAVDSKCVRNGYVKASRNWYNHYCTKVVNGNTIVIHVDSLR
jgi:prepilin-type N-terminal cleavage/methylation domain-containing protein